MKEYKLLWIILFNIVIIVSEVSFGLLSNSFALIADALHNFGDVMALIVSYLALYLARLKPSFKFTYGFVRAEMMAAFVNTLFLYLTMFYLLYEATIKLMRPQIVEAKYMIVVGMIALIANGISAYMLKNIGVSHCDHNEDKHHHHEHSDANIHSAYLHMFSDALISFGVVVGGVGIYYFHIYSIDAVLTIVFSLYILLHSYPLLKKSFLSLLDSNTTPISEEQIAQIVNENKDIISYHNLHISQPSTQERYISMHMVINDEYKSFKNIQSIVDIIRDRLVNLGFTQILIQPETKGAACTPVKQKIEN